MLRLGTDPTATGPVFSQELRRPHGSAFACNLGPSMFAKEAELLKYIKELLSGVEIVWCFGVSKF